MKMNHEVEETSAKKIDLIPSSSSSSSASFSGGSCITTSLKTHFNHLFKDTEGSGSNKKKSILFCDWDDTLFCCSFLNDKGLNIDSDVFEIMPHEHHLEELEEAVIELLKAAVNHCTETHIVTNAEQGWVELSADKFLPGVLHLLQQNKSKIQVWSARHLYESFEVSDPSEWKRLTFERLLKEFQTKMGPTLEDCNVISLGDSLDERHAVLEVTRNNSQKLGKSIKFAEKPSACQLKRQLRLVAASLPAICAFDKPLDLQLTILSNP